MDTNALSQMPADFRATITSEVLRHRGDKPAAFERAVRVHEKRFLDKLDSVQGTGIAPARDFITRYANNEIERTNALGIVELAA